jgi:uncharacterized phage protein gp47/JayE
MTPIPTLAQLYASIIADIEGELGVQIPATGRVMLRAYAAVQAAKLKLFYIALGRVQKNIFIDTADPVAIGGTLERFGLVKLNRLPFPPIAGIYTIEVTGTIGAVIPAQTTFKSDDTSLNAGFLFILDAPYTLVASTDTINVRALTAGVVSQLVINDTLTATAPIANVNREAIVTAIPTPPQAAEDIEDYRRKGVQAYRLEPQGGAASDYRVWSSDATGVRQVYPFSATGLVSEINLFVESDSGNGVPSGALLTAVQSVVEQDPDTSKPLNERGRKPITAIVNYLPVDPQLVDITITGYVGLTTEIQANITAAIGELLDDIRPFVAGADVLAERNDVLNTNLLIFTIQNAQPTGFFNSLTLDVAGNTVTTYQFLNGEIPELGTVTFA